MKLQQYVPVPVTPPPNYKAIINQMMEIANEGKDDLDGYVDNLQTAIDATRERQEAILEKRYTSIFTALERAKNNYLRFSLSLQNLKESIDKSSQMQRVLEDLQNYRTYSDALGVNIEKIQTKINEQVRKTKVFKSVIEIKHQALNQQNSKNLALLRQINQLRSNINRTKKTADSQRTKSQFQTQSLMQIPSRNVVTVDSDYSGIQQQLYQLKQDNKLLKHQLTIYRNNQYLKCDLFTDCMNAYKKSFEKSQKIVHNSGLQTSLLFEIKRAQFFVTETSAQKKLQSLNFKSQQAGRQIRNIVHETLKGMAEEKQHKKIRNLDDLDLDWDSYNQFNSQQILALLCLKPKVFNELRQLFLNELN